MFILGRSSRLPNQIIVPSPLPLMIRVTVLTGGLTSKVRNGHPRSEVRTFSAKVASCEEEVRKLSNSCSL